MKAALISDAREKTYAVIFERGDEVIHGLTEFAKQHRITASDFTAIGAFSDVVLGYFDRARKDYKEIPINEQVEVLSLAGNISLDQDKPKVHAHVVVGKADGTAWGGHVLRAHVWPTLEVIAEDTPAHLRRTHDAETGLSLIDLRASRNEALTARDVPSIASCASRHARGLL